MNTIKATLDKSDYEIYTDFLNFKIDDYWLDEQLGASYPDSMYKGLIPTLSFCLEFEEERNVVWERILPATYMSTLCPILMCPDDCDFFCTLILAEIENTGTTIRWNRLGLDQTKAYGPEKVGTSVEWLEELSAYEFKIADYQKMIFDFKNQFDLELKNWEAKFGPN